VSATTNFSVLLLLNATRGPISVIMHPYLTAHQPGHDHETDWRLTFAAAEADLFHYHSNKRALKLAYVVLKFLLKISKTEEPKGRHIAQVHILQREIVTNTIHL
jgi:hypothetical protein